MRASSEPGRPFPAAALFGILATAFTLMSAASVGWRDAGELSAAAFHLGIAHPTGFPLALVLAKALALILPLGDASLRLAIACGLAMAGAATLSAMLAAEISGPRSRASLAAAGLVAVGFVSSPTLLWFGTTMEAYSFACLLAAAALLAGFRAARDRDPRPALLACLALGLALGCHASAVIAAAAGAALGLATARPRPLALAAVALLAGALVIAYLPLRSMAGSAVMWDDLSSAGGLLSHLSATRIREAFAGRAGGSHIGWDTLVLGRMLAEDLGIVCFVLAPAGALLALRRSRTAAALLASTLVLGLAYALLMNPMGLEDRQTGILAITTALVLAGVALAEGFATLARPTRVATGLLVILLAALPFLRPQGTCRPRPDDLPTLWAGSALSGLPARALVLCTSDEMCGISLYLLSVEGLRPDVSVVPRQHLWNDTVIERTLAASHPWLAAAAASAGRTTASRLAALATARSQPVYWEVGDGRDLPLAFGPGRPPLDYGPGASPPLARVGPGDPGPDVEMALAARLLHWMTLLGHDPEKMKPCDLSFVARRMLARDFLGVGLVLAWQAKRAQSHSAFAHAVMVKPDYAPALVNLAILEAEAGRLDQAIALARRALSADPTRLKARVTLGRLLLMAGRSEEGRRILESAMTEAP